MEAVFNRPAPDVHQVGWGTRPYPPTAQSDLMPPGRGGVLNSPADGIDSLIRRVQFLALVIVLQLLFILWIRSETPNHPLITPPD